MIPFGDCFYEIRDRGEIAAFERSHLDGSRIIASRRSADGLSNHQLEATLDPGQCVARLALQYSSSLFTRKASYEAVGDDFRGRISGVTGSNQIVAKLGRFREVEVVGFVIFRTLLIHHIRDRGQTRWTGRVALIDPNTLAAASIKQTCIQVGTSTNSWIYEAQMGDREEIDLDDTGRILQCRSSRGVIAQLVVSA
jgi:hypothetical protein